MEEGKDGRGRKGRRERRKTGKVRMSSCSNIFVVVFLRWVLLCNPSVPEVVIFLPPPQRSEITGLDQL